MPSKCDAYKGVNCDTLVFGFKEECKVCHQKPKAAKPAGGPTPAPTPTDQKDQYFKAADVSKITIPVMPEATDAEKKSCLKDAEQARPDCDRFLKRAKKPVEDLINTTVPALDKAFKKMKADGMAYYGYVGINIDRDNDKDVDVRDFCINDAGSSILPPPPPKGKKEKVEWFEFYSHPERTPAVWRGLEDCKSMLAYPIFSKNGRAFITPTDEEIKKVTTNPPEFGKGDPVSWLIARAASVKKTSDELLKEAGIPSRTEYDSYGLRPPMALDEFAQIMHIYNAAMPARTEEEKAKAKEFYDELMGKLAGKKTVEERITDIEKKIEDKPSVLIVGISVSDGTETDDETEEGNIVIAVDSGEQTLSGDKDNGFSVFWQAGGNARLSTSSTVQYYDGDTGSGKKSNLKAGLDAGKVGVKFTTNDKEEKEKYLKKDEAKPSIVTLSAFIGQDDRDLRWTNGIIHFTSGGIKYLDMYRNPLGVGARAEYKHDPNNYLDAESKKYDKDADTFDVYIGAHYAPWNIGYDIVNAADGGMESEGQSADIFVGGHYSFVFSGGKKVTFFAQGHLDALKKDASPEDASPELEQDSIGVTGGAEVDLRTAKDKDGVVVVWQGKKYWLADDKTSWGTLGSVAYWFNSAISLFAESGYFHLEQVIPVAPGQPRATSASTYMEQFEAGGGIQWNTNVIGILKLSCRDMATYNGNNENGDFNHYLNCALQNMIPF